MPVSSLAAFVKYSFYMVNYTAEFSSFLILLFYICCTFKYLFIFGANVLTSLRQRGRVWMFREAEISAKEALEFPALSGIFFGRRMN